MALSQHRTAKERRLKRNCSKRCFNALNRCSMATVACRSKRPRNRSPTGPGKAWETSWEPYRKTAEKWWKEEDPKSPTTPNSEAAPGVVSQSSRKEDSSQSEASSGEEANTAPVDTSAVAKAVELAQQLRQEAEDAAQKRRQNRRKNEDTRASELGLARDASWAFHLCCLDVAKASPGRI
ncbi:unnamed protein product [Durusdinium trenchii]|uniref:Uncharacterized protein n=1 Tax=Durusdinium trenchii TaxID=1381693 RepID=A0ABP0S8V7_9DINO